MAIQSVWKEVESLKYDPPASKLSFELGVKPLLGMVTDFAVVEESEAELGTVLDIYEKRLGQSKYLGGECFSLTDLHHLPTLDYLMQTQAKKLFECRPNVSAWVADITSRPAWAKVVAMKPH